MLQEIKYIIYGEAKNLPVNIRIFSAMSFAIILITSLQCTVNLVLESRMAVVFVFIGIIPASIIFYFARFKQQYYFIPLILQICLILSVDWFYKGGINGAVFVAVLLSLPAFYIISPAKYHRYLLIVILPLFLSLIGIQYAYPELFSSYPSRKAQFIDIGIAFISLSLVMAAIFYTYNKSHEENRELIEDQNKTIVTSYTKLKAVEEELRQNSEELLASNERLDQEKVKAEEALIELKKAKDQLVQSEKMASLGVLTAGIAHEINNPVNFISVGNQVLKDMISEAMGLLEKYEQIDQEGIGQAEKVLLKKELIALKEEIGGLKEFREDTLSMFHEIQTGVRRVTEIVKGLKSFSHSNDEQYELVNIHGLLNNSLMILRSKHKGIIRINKDYSSSLPLIPCMAGQISQVFVNIINNAIYATPEGGEISITTDIVNEHAVIIIKDTGLGMPDAVLKQVFNPFYTTKPVGEGTGLGLSISYGIIESHQGNIQVYSKEGEGTAFDIRLPKQQHN